MSHADGNKPHLKLASYRWDPSAGVMAAGVGAMSTGGMSTLGDWVMLGLDEVLADIQQQFDAIYGTLEDFYNETLAVLQMAMTAWYQGQTVYSGNWRPATCRCHQCVR
jgi:hypothetical protein